MGVSTDAIVMFGVALEEGWETSDSEGNEIDSSTIAEDDPRKLVELEEDLGDGLELETHCSYDCPMYILGYGATRRRAWRGHPVVVPEFTPQDEKAILAYCKKWKLPIDKNVNKGRPGWLLFSMWG